MDEVEPPEHPLHADALSDLSRLMPEIVRLTQLSTRWTGILIVRGLEFGLAGQKHGWCGISIRDDVLAVSEYRWSTMIHEGLHGVSAAFSPTRLDPTNQRWEEAIVEQTQRILRTELLESLGVTLDQAVLGARDDTHRYNIYIRALEIQRNAEGQDAWEFYLELHGSPRPVRVRKLMTAWRALAEERDKGL